MGREDRLADLLNHYFEHAWTASGLTWTYDNRAEIDLMASLITDIAAAEAQIEIARSASREHE